MAEPARPTFTIGVTSYDRHDLLTECLRSLSRQTFADFEVIVGNDKPGDVVNGEVLGIDDPRIRFVDHARNLGEMQNMNALLAMGRGKYFTWLADDDMYAPNFLEAVHGALVGSDRPSCVFTSYHFDECFTDDISTVNGETRIYNGRGFLDDYLGRRVTTQGCYGVFETEYLWRIGGMAQLGTGFSPYSDVLLAIKAGLLDRVAYIDAPLVLFRAHENSISLTSSNTDAFASAQGDFLSKSLEVLRHGRLRPDLQSNLERLLKRCVAEYYGVVRRSESLHWRKFSAHLLSLRKYSRLLGRNRFALEARAVLGAGKLVANILLARMQQPGRTRYQAPRAA